MKCNCFVVYEIDAVSRDQGSSCDLLLKILCQVDSHGYVIYSIEERIEIRRKEDGKEEEEEKKEEEEREEVRVKEASDEKME